jgi:hypothetical protein
MYDDCIDMNSNVFEAPLEFVDVDRIKTLVGVFKLSKKEIFLAIQALQSSLRIANVDG